MDVVVTSIEPAGDRLIRPFRGSETLTCGDSIMHLWVQAINNNTGSNAIPFILDPLLSLYRA